MEAADESKRQGGKPVTIESVMAKAKSQLAQVASGVDATSDDPDSDAASVAGSR